jgi:two-component system, OmpR family, copper resistance phosphate regulon response regulator CusR
MRILLVEDEPSLGRHMKRALSDAGHVVDLVTDGIDGKHYALEGDYQLVVLDVALPGTDGFNVLEALRRTKPTPVILVTAKGSLPDRLNGFQLGADDYLVKPIEITELLARIEAIARRALGPSSTQTTHLSVGDLEVDFKSHRAYRAGNPVDLTAKEMKILQVLLDYRDQIVSRTMLAELVWEMHFDTGTNAVEVAMRRLRAKIDDPYSVKLIETVRGRGYRLSSAD